MHSPEIEASVIVPARNASATLGRTLTALARQDVDINYEVIVVDDGSTDHTSAIAERSPGPVVTLRQPPEGPAAARNRAAAHARGDLLAFTDADCFPEPGWLAAGQSACRHADLVVGRVRPDPAARMGPFDRSLGVDRDVGLYEMANLFVRRIWFARVGGIEEWLEPKIGKAMAEDLWFGWRLRRAGARVTFCEDALVHHAVFPRGPRAYVADRRRTRYFADIVRKVPEIRESLFFSRYFLTRRTAAFDTAVAATVAAIARRSPVPAIAALPYLVMLFARVARHPAVGAQVLAADVAADAVGCVSLLFGSARRRTLVL